MVFTTPVFVFYFLPLFLLVYYSLPYGWRNVWITLASYVFYGWWNPWFIALLLAVTTAHYLCGRIITQAGASARQQFWGMALAVACGLGVLGFFKYGMFCQTNLNQVLGGLGLEPWSVLQIVLPMGISFYVFKALSYTFDLYRGTLAPARSWSDFACYLALYPQLEAGPIERFNAVAGQLACRGHTREKFSQGVALFILGFAKKVLLANPAGEIASAAFSAQSLPIMDAWFGALAYTFQIYFDFSGYSDMAVGLGRMIGFEFMKNFNAPYHAESITEFWRRWHISLSGWFRDYVFLPLELATRNHPCPNRRLAVNLLLTMLLVGLWHGAGWTFIAWGAYHGALLAFERWQGKHSVYLRLPRPGRIGLTFLLLLFSWVLFRADNMTAAMEYLQTMLGLGPAGNVAPLLAATIYTPCHLLILAACAGLVFQPLQAHDWAQSPVTWGRTALLAPLFVFSLLAMFSQDFNPFLYFQF